MAKVKRLDPLVAERIAAGEVVERPSAVVKELVENSLDAGATRIQVRLEEGGRSLIEIIDNGEGMEADDLALCVERHATSKIRAFEDLEKLNSLGFRGEALPSIDACAELTFTTRSKNAPKGDAHRYASKVVSPTTFGEFLGSPHGSLVRVEALFAQMPARLKFLKSPASETSAVREILERLALSHPEVEFRLFSGEREVLSFRTQTPEARNLAVLAGGERDLHLVHKSFHEPAGTIELYWVQGLSLPHSRKIYQFVNGRALKDRLLSQAIVGAFRQSLLPGNYPSISVSLTLNPANVDVNVHPTKSEVRFFESSKVFRLVQSALEKTIETHGTFGVATAPVWSPMEREALGDVPMDSAAASDPVSYSGSSSEERSSNSSFSHFRANEPVARDVTPWLNPQQMVQTEFVDTAPPRLQVTDTWFSTYWVVPRGEEIWLIDQHAAHERIRYEQLKKRWLDGQSQDQASQQLLIPEVIHSSEQVLGEELEQTIAVLTGLGFELESFGGDKIVFRAVPSQWGSELLALRLKSLWERAVHLVRDEPGTSQDFVMDEQNFERLAMQACRSSIKGGDRVRAEIGRELINQLLDCEHPWNCPHGRPTVVRLKESQVEEWFSRRV